MTFPVCNTQLVRGGGGYLHFPQTKIISLRLQTCVDSSGENPGPGGDCSFDEALAHHLLDAWVQIKVLNPSMDWDEDLGQLHMPFLQHQPQDALWPRVVGQTHILQAFTQTQQKSSRMNTLSGEKQQKLTFDKLTQQIIGVFAWTTT